MADKSHALADAPNASRPPRPNWSKKWLGERLPWSILLVGVALVLLSTTHRTGWLEWLIPVLQPHVDGIFEAVKEFGMAFVIAGVAALSIERSRAKAFSKELSVEVKDKLKTIEEATTSLVMRGPLPTAYYEHVLKGMLSPRFVLLDWNIRIELAWNDELDPKHEFLEFSFAQDYKIRNLHSFSAAYNISHFESLDWDDRFPATTRMRYLRAFLDGGPGLLVNMAPSPDKPLGEIDARAGLIRLSHAQEIPADGVLCVETAVVKVLKEREFETRIIREPTMGVKLLITCPAELKVNLELPQLLLEDEVFEPKLGEELLSDGRKQSHWHIPRPMPPSTYITVAWRKATLAEGLQSKPAPVETVTPSPRVPAASEQVKTNKP